ncbi:MAG: DASS family sodium-coupled anion symporter [Candidatus Thermoplasmatota archaeon]
MVDTSNSEGEEQKNLFEREVFANLTYKKIFYLLLAFLVLAVFHFYPSMAGLSSEGQTMIGILLMAAILWISEPIPLAVTGLLVMLTQPLLGVLSTDSVFSSFGNEAVFFLIGAFILASAIEKHGLHRRIALRFLSFFEQSPRYFTFGIMLACALMSFIMPEHGVAALFLPIITSVLIVMKVVPKQSNFGKVSMLSVAYGCSIGSLGTLIGGARNPLTVAFLSEQNITITFFEWMKYSLPIVFLALPLVWLVLQFSFPLEVEDMTLAKKEISNQVAKMGSFDRKESVVTGVLFLTIFLWLFFSHSALGLAGIALLGGSLLFISGSLEWEDVEKRIPWGVVLLYGGAITLGVGLQSTGAANWIARQIFSSLEINIFLVIIGLIVFTILLTNVMSNTGAVAVLLPIGLAVSNSMSNISPLFSSMLIALSGGLAFMLVIATPGNAITYSSGYYSIRDLFKAGLIANLICIAVIFLVAVVYWMGVLKLHLV